MKTLDYAACTICRLVLVV